MLSGGLFCPDYDKQSGLKDVDLGWINFKVKAGATLGVTTLTYNNIKLSDYFDPETTFESAHTNLNITIAGPIVYHRVTFYVSGEIYASGDVEDGETALSVKPVTDPEPPALHLFDGWYSGDTLYTFDEAVIADIDLVARFVEKPHVLDAVDGTPETCTRYPTDQRFHRTLFDDC